MKITRFLFPLLLIGSLSARAQFAVIPVVGGNIVTYWGARYNNFEGFWPGWKAGVMGEVATHTFGVQTGALYSSFASGSVRVNCLEIPAIFITKFGREWRRNRFVAGFGPFISFQVNATARSSSGTGTITISAERYAPPTYLGLHLSIGHEFQNGMYSRLALQPSLESFAQRGTSYIMQINALLGYVIPFGKDMDIDKDAPKPTKEQ